MPWNIPAASSCISSRALDWTVAHGTAGTALRADVAERRLENWMQTWLVHMRSPLRLARELGLPGFAVFQLLVGGTVLAALVHVLFAARLIWMLALTPMDDATIAGAAGLRRRHAAGRLSDLGRARTDRTGAAAAARLRLGAAADAGLLAAAVACGVARAVSIAARSVSLGEDRARACPHLRAAPSQLRDNASNPPPPLPDAASC